MKLSFIVSTRNRAHTIVTCLNSIAQSIAEAELSTAEIVVVDNASDDNTSSVVREYANSSSFPVNLKHEPRKGLSVSRNCGIRAALGDLIVFTDDDCCLSNKYVADVLRHDANDKELVLRGGSVKLGDPNDLPLTIKTVAATTRWKRSENSARRENLGNSLLGCNMTMRRALIECLGPFDERLGAGSNIPGGEDTDYIFRAYLAGLVIEAVPDMEVFHYHGRKQLSDGKKLLCNYSTGGGALYAKYILRHPNLCRQFYWDVKGAMKEVVFGRNTFMPEIDFSHKDKVLYNIIGAMKYFASEHRMAL